jgi:hypothetical protein
LKRWAAVPMGPTMRLVRHAALLLLVLLTGTAWSGLRQDRAAAAEPVRHPAGEYPGDLRLAPVDVVRAYVRAIDRRDGARFCSLIVPWISGEYDLATRDPDSIYSVVEDCPGFVSASIGRSDEGIDAVLVGARVESASALPELNGLVRVDARIRVVMDTGSARVKRRFRDRIWLTRVEDGSWRVAKLSLVASKATLWFGDDEKPLAAPDVAQGRAWFASDLVGLETALRKREASFAPVGPAASCGGGVSTADPPHDVESTGKPLRPQPPGASAVDIRRVRVAARGGRVCVRWQMVGPVKGHLLTVYEHRTRGRGKHLDGDFLVELREDGTARVTAGLDGDGRPIVVPATVGHSGRVLSLELDATSFRSGSRGHLRIAWHRFGFRVEALPSYGSEPEIHDDLGGGDSGYIDYPSGRRVRLS